MAQGKVERKKQTNGNDRRNVWLIIVMVILMVASVVVFMPPQEKINQGLDIQGGLSVVLTANTTDGSAITDDQMEESRSIIESRVNSLGATEAVVQIQGDNQILVQIPGMTDTETALATIGKTGKLEFARLDSFTDSDVASKISSGSYGGTSTVSDGFGNYFTVEDSSNALTVVDGTYTPIVTGENIQSVTIDRASETSSYYAVDITLDSAGTTAFAKASSDLVSTNGQIVIILDNQVQSAPAVQSEIPDGRVSITGNYSLEEAQSLKTILESGSLPVSFSYSQSQVVGPTLGQDALASGVLVAIIGLIIVMIYLLFFYKGLGIITAAAMVVFSVLYLGILAALSAFGQFSLSLAGVAGIVLTIGMAADSSILTVERFREEIRMGRSVRAASITGVRHAILTSIDADLVSLVSALCLFFLAAASVKGFGMTLALGIVCDVVMMLVFKAPLIRLIAPRIIKNNPGFWGIKDGQVACEAYGELGAVLDVSAGEAEIGEAMDADEVDRIAADRAGNAGSEIAAKIRNLKGRFIKHDIPFLGVRKILLTISAVLVVLSLVCVGVRGLNFGIEFVGGTSVTFHNTGDVTTEQVRAAFEEAGEPDAVIQTTFSDGEEGFLVRTTTTDAQDAATVANQVASELGWTANDFEVSTIGPDWGSSVIRASVIAFLVSLVLIIIYIAIRFREYKMGVVAVIALLHDLIIVVGIYALVGREMNPNTIAALLTILGYSLYDTVVVFHRIVDNMKDLNIKCSFMTMANHSVNQVFLRSINTTLTSLIPVLAMLIFGGETLKDFAFAMTIGLIAGAYSSISVAAPLFSMWKSREQNYKRLAKKYGDRVGHFDFERSGDGASASVGKSKRSRKKTAVAKAANFEQVTNPLADTSIDTSLEEIEARVAEQAEEAAQAAAAAEEALPAHPTNDRARGGKRKKKR